MLLQKLFFPILKSVVNLGLLLADLRLPSHLKKVCNGEIVHKTEKNPCKKRTFIYTLQLHLKWTMVIQLSFLFVKETRFINQGCASCQKSTRGKFNNFFNNLNLVQVILNDIGLFFLQLNQNSMADCHWIYTFCISNWSYNTYLNQITFNFLNLVAIKK